MIQLHLFRIKIEIPKQALLFVGKLTPAELLRAMVSERPSAELRRGYEWHIGNLAELKPDGLYFALGRTTQTIVERYDEKKGNFVEEPFESSPYTHVVLDTQLGVAAIAVKSRLAPSVPGIARKLRDLLASSRTATENRLNVAIQAIADPHDFIRQLRSAYSIERFAMTFGLPNPWDVNADFQAPLQSFLREAEGQKGRAAVAGKNLSASVLEELARSAAATGEDAEASLRTAKGRKPIRRGLRRNPATVQVADLDEPGQKQEALANIRIAYEGVRTPESEKEKS